MLQFMLTHLTCPASLGKSRHGELSRSPDCLGTSLLLASTVDSFLTPVRRSDDILKD